MYLIREGLCLFVWKNSCLQVQGVHTDFPHRAVPSTLSHRPDQGWGHVTTKSIPAQGHGSSLYLQGTDSSTGCLQMSLLLLWASCPACLPSHPNLPILAPWGFSSPALQKAPCCFGSIWVESVSPQTPHLCLSFLWIILNSCRVVVRGKSKSKQSAWLDCGSGRQSSLSSSISSSRPWRLHRSREKCVFSVNTAFLCHVFVCTKLFHITGCEQKWPGSSVSATSRGLQLLTLPHILLPEVPLGLCAVWMRWQ